MTPEPSISVRGEATLEVEPEIAVVNVTVTARDKDRRRVLDLLASRNGKVLAAVRAYGDAVEKVESGAASVQPQLRDGGKAKERGAGYLARSTIGVTVSDFTVLGDLITALADEDMVAVMGPWWRLRPGSPVHRQARMAAARDATLRARDYAEAFGARVTGLTEAADTGLLTTASEAGPPRHLMARAAGAQAMAAPAELEFEPLKQIVQAHLEARFTMTPPDLGTP